MNKNSLTLIHTRDIQLSNECWQTFLWQAVYLITWPKNCPNLSSAPCTVPNTRVPRFPSQVCLILTSKSQARETLFYKMEDCVSKKKRETNKYNILYCFPYLLYCTLLSGDNNIIIFDSLYDRTGWNFSTWFSAQLWVRPGSPNWKREVCNGSFLWTL